MLKLAKLAVTGGLSCGKSSACRFFKELGAYIISADEIVHQLLSSNTTLGQQVIKLIGPDIVVNQQIDRSKIANKVFNQPQLLKSLEVLLHPVVYKEIERRYQEVKNDPKIPLFVAEIPLLFESGGDSFFDYTVAVVADDSVCQQRFQLATGLGPEEYAQRAARQLSPSEKARRANFVIINNNSPDQMRKEIEQIFQFLQY